MQKRKFEIIWNELFNSVVEIYLPTDNKGLEINFPLTKIHLQREMGILEHCRMVDGFAYHH